MHEPCPMPASFPLAAYDELIALLSVASHIRGWSRFASALNGIAYRYRGTVEAHDRFAATFVGAFGGEERYEEEAALFSVFSNGAPEVTDSRPRRHR